METPLLAVNNLTIAFDTDEGSFTAVEGVSFDIRPGEIVGLVGESGCGKSVTALGLLRLIPSPPGRIVGGQIALEGQDLLSLPIREMRRIRGQTISMIFQEPGSALSPLHKIGRQLIETVRLHRDVSRNAAAEMAEEWLRKVRIPDPKERMSAYPHQLSGGMQQRVMIAMALMLEPRIVIADEPTTALDVTIQAQIFEVIREMRQRETAVLLITHDLGVVWEMCDRVVVMYAARIAESAPVDALFRRPAHPYTRGLLTSIPRLSGQPGKLSAISGQVPSPMHFPSGCHFRDRCPHAFDRCATEIPPAVALERGHHAACFLVEEGH